MRKEGRQEGRKEGRKEGGRTCWETIPSISGTLMHDDWARANRSNPSVSPRDPIYLFIRPSARFFSALFSLPLRLSTCATFSSYSPSSSFLGVPRLLFSAGGDGSLPLPGERQARENEVRGISGQREARFRSPKGKSYRCLSSRCSLVCTKLNVGLRFRRSIEATILPGGSL